MAKINNLSATRHSFAPRPRNINETGLTHEFLESLVCKLLHVNGVTDLHELSGHIALSGTILETILESLRKENKVEILAATHSSTGTRYTLTDKGRNEALAALNKSGYYKLSAKFNQNYMYLYYAYRSNPEENVMHRIYDFSANCTFHKLSIDLDHHHNPTSLTNIDYILPVVEFLIIHQ